MARLILRALVSLFVTGLAFAAFLVIAAPLMMALFGVVRLSNEGMHLISNVIPVICFVLALAVAWGVDRAWNRKAKVG